MKKKTTRVAYKVECHHCRKTFDKAFEIEEGSKHLNTEVEAYCPHCDKVVGITVRGKVEPDETLLRKFFPDQRS